MTRGSNKPLVPPLEDPESILHKKIDKNVKEDQTPKSSSFKDLKSVFGKKKGKNMGEYKKQIRNDDFLSKVPEYAKFFQDLINTR